MLDLKCSITLQILTTRLPGRFKLLGGAMKLLAKVADPTVGRVLKSPRTGRDPSVLGGTAGAGLVHNTIS